MIEEFIKQWWDRNGEQMQQWRHYLHTHPELSHMEFETTKFVAEKLTEAGLSPVLFPNTGLMVDIGDANVAESKVGGEFYGRLAFRGDMDALPITEATELPFKSQNDGVMHACGHDFHTMITLATALAMAEYDQKYGLPVPLRFIFQPAEEVMDGGAPEVIAFGALEGVDRIFAVHCEPKLRVGHIGVRTGAITSASDTIEIRVEGPGGHTSRPHLTADVVYTLGKLITDLPGLLSRRVDPRSGTVLVFGSVNSGYAFNAIPSEGTLSGTIRTADIAIWRSFGPLLRELVSDIVASTGASATVQHDRGVPPVLNDDVCTAQIADAVRSVDENALVRAPQSSGGEDFGWYLEHVPGSMARLGCWSGKGEKYDLHRDDIIIDERCLGVGVRLFSGIVARYESPELTSALH